MGRPEAEWVGGGSASICAQADFFSFRLQAASRAKLAPILYYDHPLIIIKHSSLAI
jgi:hypothetical protein